MEERAVVLEMGPHDIAAIPAASLWELCRSYDAEMGKSVKSIYSGLCVFAYFKLLTETGKVANYDENGGITQ